MAADYAVEYINVHAERFSGHEREIVSAEASRYHVDKLEEAGAVGTAGHDIVERYTHHWISNGVREDIRKFIHEGTDTRAIAVARSAVKFMEDYNVFPVAAELKVWSENGNYAGTLDNISLIGTVYKGNEGSKECAHEWLQKAGKKDKVGCMKCGRELKLTLALLDWKSSNVIMGFGKFGKYEYAMQVAAYRQALEELTGLKPKIIWIIRLSKDRCEYEIGVVDDWKRSLKAYRQVSDLYDFATSQQQPIVPLFMKQKIMI